MYGIIRHFVRVGCYYIPHFYTDIAIVDWFAPPHYPDGDPLLVCVDQREDPAPAPRFIKLTDIDPARVLYEIDGDNYIYMMRVEGLDVMPQPQE